MADDGAPNALSPTVKLVLDTFVQALQGDETIEKAEIARLEELLRSGLIPKPDEIARALFPSSDGESV